jgi:hypothetical protein
LIFPFSLIIIVVVMVALVGLVVVVPVRPATPMLSVVVAVMVVMVVMAPEFPVVVAVMVVMVVMAPEFPVVVAMVLVVGVRRVCHGRRSGGRALRVADVRQDDRRQGEYQQGNRRRDGHEPTKSQGCFSSCHTEYPQFSPLSRGRIYLPFSPCKGSKGPILPNIVKRSHERVERWPQAMQSG